MPAACRQSRACLCSDEINLHSGRRSGSFRNRFRWQLHGALQGATARVLCGHRYRCLQRPVTSRAGRTSDSDANCPFGQHRMIPPMVVHVGHNRAETDVIELLPQVAFGKGHRHAGFYRRAVYRTVGSRSRILVRLQQSQCAFPRTEAEERPQGGAGCRYRSGPVIHSAPLSRSRPRIAHGRDVFPVPRRAPPANAIVSKRGYAPGRSAL